MLLSVPVDSGNTVYFKVHHTFTRDYILSLFDDFNFIEEKYQYGSELVDEYDSKRGFGTGLFIPRKIGT